MRMQHLTKPTASSTGMTPVRFSFRSSIDSTFIAVPLCFLAALSFSTIERNISSRLSAAKPALKHFGEAHPDFLQTEAGHD